MVKREVKNEKSKGFTLIEMILVLAVLVTFLALVFTIYKNRVEPSRWANNKFQTFQSVIAAIENARSANGGAYPASSSPFDLDSSDAPTNDKQKLVWYAVTGGSPTSDLAGWKYACDSGNLDITVGVSDKPAAGDAAITVFTESVKNNLGFTVSGSNNSTVTFRRAGVICN